MLLGEGIASSHPSTPPSARWAVNGNTGVLSQQMARQIKSVAVSIRHTSSFCLEFSFLCSTFFIQKVKSSEKDPQLKCVFILVVWCDSGRQFE